MTNDRYAVIIEKGDTSYGAYVPDLPGCVAVGDSAAEVTQLIQEAIGFHIRGLLRDGDPVPPPTSQCCYVQPAEAPSLTNGRRKGTGRKTG